MNTFPAPSSFLMVDADFLHESYLMEDPMDVCDNNVKSVLEAGRRFLQIEMEGLTELQHQLDEHFVQAVQWILACDGKIVVTGMGKSGHIGRKIAATLSSTGTPALFLHPGEGVHGDLGVVARHDLVILLSNSGTTAEMLQLLPSLRAIGCRTLSITQDATSPLATQTSLHLSCAVSREACPLALAPTSSTTALLVLGDALALCVMEQRRFTPEQFALYHPQGSLGRRLLTRVEDLMLPLERLPLVSPETTLRQGVVELSHKRLGLLIIVDAERKLLGVFSNGDLARLLEDPTHDPSADWSRPLSDWMRSGPLHIDEKEMALAAKDVMQARSVLTLVVTNRSQQVRGAIQLYDILRAGV
jgi:arabinose-5-phosphate isomerase